MSVDGKDWKLTGNFSSRIRKKGEDAREENRDRHDEFMQKSKQAKNVANALLHQTRDIKQGEAKQTVQRTETLQQSTSSSDKKISSAMSNSEISREGHKEKAGKNFVEAAQAATNLQKLSTKQIPKVNVEPKQPTLAKQGTEKTSSSLPARNTFKTDGTRVTPEAVPGGLREKRRAGTPQAAGPETKKSFESVSRETKQSFENISRKPAEAGQPLTVKAGPVTKDRFESTSENKKEFKKDETKKNASSTAASASPLSRSRKENLGELEAGVSSRFGGESGENIIVQDGDVLSSLTIEEFPQPFETFNAEAGETAVVAKGRQYKYFIEKTRDQLNAIREFDEELEMGLQSLAKRVLTDDPDLKLSTADFIKNIYGGTRA